VLHKFYFTGTGTGLQAIQDWQGPFVMPNVSTIALSLVVSNVDSTYWAISYRIERY
jgi:hypothetical protein